MGKIIWKEFIKKFIDVKKLMDDASLMEDFKDYPSDFS